MSEPDLVFLVEGKDFGEGYQASWPELHCKKALVMHFFLYGLVKQLLYHIHLVSRHLIRLHILVHYFRLCGHITAPLRHPLLIRGLVIQVLHQELGVVLELVVVFFGAEDALGPLDVVEGLLDYFEGLGLGEPLGVVAVHVQDLEVLYVLYGVPAHNPDIIALHQNDLSEQPLVLFLVLRRLHLLQEFLEGLDFLFELLHEHDEPYGFSFHVGADEALQADDDVAHVLKLLLDEAPLSHVRRDVEEDVVRAVGVLVAEF